MTDAESLLARVKAEGRARLRVYIGAAPGVGKSYQMLEDAHELKRQGIDVVVGFVETHGRADTFAQIRDLEVVAIDRSSDARGARAAEQLGVPLIVGDAGREETLRAASIETCKALVVLSTDDVTNLKAALNARADRPDVRVVLRLFDSDFAGRVQTAFNIDISRSVSRLVAPAFAAAMLDRDVVVTIPVDRHALLVASVQVLAGSPLEGARLRTADRPLSVRVIGLSVSDSEWVDWSPDLARELVAGDRILVVARRAGLRILLEEATPPPLEEAGLDAAQ